MTGLDHNMHCVFSGLCCDCMCMIVCANYVNYIRGMMYIGNANTRVEKCNIRSSETNGLFGILSILLVGMCANSWTRT